MTIRKKVLYGLLGFSLVSVFITTLIAMSASIKNVDTLYRDRIETIAGISASALQEIVDLYKDEIITFSINESVQDYVDLMAETDTSALRGSPQPGALVEPISKYMGAAGKFEDILILDKDGVAVISYQPGTQGLDLSDTDSFQRVLNGNDKDYVHISQVHSSLTSPDNPQGNCIGISKALYSSDGRLQGVLVGFLNTKQLGKFAQNISFGRTGLAFVIDSRNFILYHPEPVFLNTKTTAPKLQDMIMRYKNGRIPSSGRIEDIMDGQKRVYYYVVLDKDDLVLVLRQDSAEAASDILNNILLLLGVFAVITAVIVYFGSKISRGFVMPILKIKEAFDASQRDGAYLMCEVTTDDEIGDMAAGYNRMIKTLETQFQYVQNEKLKTERASMHDSVTDLNNRAAFEKGLNGLINGEEQSFGVLFLDLDGFKQINDVLGHAFGDTVLYMLGRRIKNSEAKFDMHARLGGDEFALLKVGPRDEVESAALILLEELRRPFKIEMHTLHVTTSIGCSMYPADGESAEVLVKNADIAMYYAKDNGKNMFAFFDEEMQKRLDRQSDIMDILRKSIDDNRIFLMYQPYVDLKTRKVAGYEALMRLNSLKLGEVLPTEFIPIAEINNSLINNLGHWALVRACRFARRMIGEAGFDGVVSVNISAIQLRRDNFVDEVLGILKGENLDARHLQLEFTESMLMFDKKSNMEKISRLRKIGVSVAMDDFGTHYSSFNNMLYFPLDVIKIDRAFFKGIENDERMFYINKTINDISHKLELKVAAEAVETEREREFIVETGYDILQGYCLSRPLSEEDALEWHKRYHTNPPISR